MATQREWPRVRQQKVGIFAHPDGNFHSNRDVVGPLRNTTASGAGPRNRTVGGASYTTDYGMDRMEQRPVDRIGKKYPEVDPPVGHVADIGRRRR